ncbi:MAG: IclR family transcriptional regulator C-terminal domain-containing protein [Haloarculaceae archaeon]
MTSDASYEIDATGTSLDVLEHLVDAGEPVGVSELAVDLGISKSVVHNHLSTLRNRGYVAKRDREYAPSLRLLALAERTRGSTDRYREGWPAVENLADATGEAVELFLMEEHYAVPIAIAAGSSGWLPPHTCGERMSLHVNAAGKAILSSLPDDRLAGVLAELELTAATDSTVTDRGELEAEIRRIRDSSVAFCREEQYDGVVGVAAPIGSGESDRGAALMIEGPSERLRGRYFEEDLVGQVVSTVNEIEVAFTE